MAFFEPHAASVLFMGKYLQEGNSIHHHISPTLLPSHDYTGISSAMQAKSNHYNIFLTRLAKVAMART